MDRNTRQWRALAVAGASAVAALTARVVLIRRGRTEAAWQLARDYFSGKRPLVPDDVESWDQEIERRLQAVEVHLQNLPPERG
jgi:hypothetical protein